MSVKKAEVYIASDKNGMFPRTSNRGMKYICVFYIYDPNLIKGILLKIRNKEELFREYKEICAYCEIRGFKPKLHKMDNETSKYIEYFIAIQQTSQQYTPPYMHLGNPELKAIQTYKSCVKFTIASFPPTFSIVYWYRLLTQVYLSINFLRKCRHNPLLSAWTAMEGEYNFYAMPVSPLGSEMLMHENPNRRTTFGYNAKKAWYIAPCFNHYWTFKGILPSIVSERVSDTVRFKHHDITIPQLVPSNKIVETARQLDDGIKQKSKRAPMDELTAIELLRYMLLGERKENYHPTVCKPKRQKKEVVL